MQKGKTKAFVIVLLGVLGASTSSLWVRYSDAPSLTLAFYRMAFAAVILLFPVVFRHLPDIKRLKRKTVLMSMLSGVFVSFHFWFYFLAVHQTTLSAATLLANLEVFFVGGIMYFLFRERMSKGSMLGAGLTFLGSLILCIGDGLSGGNVIGDLLAFAAGLAVAFYTVIGRRIREKEEVPTNLYTFLVYATAAATLGILCLVTKTPVFGYARTGFNMAMGLGLTVFCTLLGHSIFSWGLRYIKAAVISTMKLAEPVFASVCGMILFTEIPTLPTVMGGIVILIGVWLCTKYAKE